MSRSSSNIIFSNLVTFQNIINTLSNLEIINSNYIHNHLFSDYIKTGSCNRFIINDVYDRNATFTSNIITSNFITSNLSIYGSNDLPSLYINQYNTNENILEIYSNDNPALIISSNGNIAINKNYQELIEQLEILGNFKIEGHIYPEIDDSFNLGKITNRWKDLYLSGNLITSNLSVIGDSTVLNTTVYQTEQLQVVNDTTATPIIIKQLSPYYNVAEFYNSNNPALIIGSNANIGINRFVSDTDEKVEILGNLRIEGNYYPSDDITFNIGSDDKKIKNTYTSNLYSSNITINSSNDHSSLFINQKNGNEKILETYYNNNPALIISSNGYIGINREVSSDN